MAIQIDARELSQILELMPPEQNILLVGRHGIGKSQIIQEHYQAKKMQVVPFFLGQMSDPGDLIGLMHKNEKTGHSEFMPPWWWPDDERPVVLFLDEMNRARPEILQSIMDLALNRILAGRRLPKGSIVVSAVNEGEQYQLTDLDPALVSRFNVYHFQPTVADWLVWADKQGLDARVIQFIRQNPAFLDGDDATTLYKDGFANSLQKSPDRRAWVRVSHFVAPLPHLDDLHFKSIAGIVGMQAATHFRKSLATVFKVTPEQALLDFEKHKAALKKMRLEELLFLSEGMALWLNGNHFDAKDRAKILGHLGQYLLWLKAEKQNEALAHFASLLEDPRFGKMSGWVLIESPAVLDVLQTFIKGIAL